MVARKDILAILETIPDPEMPISIVDLGIVDDVHVSDDDAAGTSAVEVAILPTFVGCPALPMIESDIRSRVGAMAGVRTVDVQFRFDPPWSVDRITDRGRRQLAEHGVRVPTCGGAAEGPVGPGTGTPVSLTSSALACPFCDSRNTRLDSPFGPTRCRTIWYCLSCRNAFEGLKRVPVDPGLPSES